MLELQDLYSKFSNISFKNRLKPSCNALSTPPSPFLGKINTSNLAPLSADTVSFTGKGQLQKIASSTAESLSAKASEAANEIFDNASKGMNHRAYGVYRELIPIAGEVNRQAKKLQNSFEITMCIFDSLVDEGSKSCKKYKPLVKKTIRAKSPQSIAKKMSVKVAELQKKNNGYNVPVSEAFIKSELHDLLGARLILANGTRAETNSVVNRLIESIESGHGPKVKFIKNYGAGHKYLTASKSDALELASYKAYGHYPEVISKKKTSGYTATHIIIDVGNGVDAEIQILGRGVEKVKEIDDICYKGLQGKALSGMPDVSKALKAVSRDPELKREFDKYITSAYELARTEWDKMPDEELVKQKFPKIDTDIFPSCLDFNNIAALLEEKSLKKHK